MEETIELQPGDVVLTAAHGGGPVSRLIKWATRDIGEAPTRVSHVALVLEPAPWLPDHDENFLNSRLIESTWPRVIDDNTLRHYANRGPVWVWRNTTLTPEQRQAIVDAAATRVGQRYGRKQLRLFALTAVVAKALGYLVHGLAKLTGTQVKWSSPKFYVENGDKPLVCSQFAAWSYMVAGASLPDIAVPWGAVDPDTIDDWLVFDCGQTWQLVWTNQPEESDDDR